jgi:hypothetical protein
MITDRFQVKLEWRTTFGTVSAPPPPAGSGQLFYFISDANFKLLQPFLTGPGCWFDSERFLVLCPASPVKRYVIRLGQLDDKLKVSARVPKLPSRARIDLGAGDDWAKGGVNAEKINPGKGEDKVIAGRGDDTTNSVDGEPDFIDGGPGHDTATVDGKDTIKNVEVVKRK